VKREKPKSPSNTLHGLLDHKRVGDLDSEGSFTLNMTAAVKMLGAYQLPFDFAWALKFVQAAVAYDGLPLVREMFADEMTAMDEEEMSKHLEARAKYWAFPLSIESICVEQTQDETIFCFPLPWGLERLERAFFEPLGPDRALGHLMTGLWNVAFREKRSFVLVTEDESSIWNGTEFQRVRTRRDTFLGVHISHWPVGQRTPVLKRREAHRINKGVARILAERACLCPIDLWINGERVSPRSLATHPNTSHECLYFGWTFGEPSSLGLSASTKDFIGSPSHMPETVSSAWFVNAHVGHRKLSLMPYNGNSWYLRPKKSRSHLAWLNDGIIIRTDPIDLPKHRTAIFVFTSANHLKTDISGFSLIEDDDYQARYQAACLGVSRGLQNVKRVHSDRVCGVIPGTGVVGGVVAAVAGGTVWASLTGSGLGLLLGGLHFYTIFASKNESFQSKHASALFQKDFQALRQDWLRKFDVLPLDGALLRDLSEEIHRPEEIGWNPGPLRNAHNAVKSELLFQRGQFYLEQGQVAKALRYLEKSDELKPGQWDVLMGLAEACLRLGMDQEASHLVQKIWRLAPQEAPRLRQMLEEIAKD
jgi:tetratricopeptide (TPR) repeat protein